jgi:hypothetical protein
MEKILELDYTYFCRVYKSVKYDAKSAKRVFKKEKKTILGLRSKEIYIYIHLVCNG